MRLIKRFKATVTPSNPPTSTSSVSPSEAYTLLSNERRRTIIAYLVNMSESTTNASEIADFLSSIGQDRNSAYISCTQQHLPRMAQIGVIDYDDRGKTVRPLSSLNAVYEAHKAVEYTLG